MQRKIHPLLDGFFARRVRGNPNQILRPTRGIAGVFARKCAGYFAASLMIAGVFMTSGCGGGGDSPVAQNPPNPPVTPPVTYTPDSEFVVDSSGTVIVAFLGTEANVNIPPTIHGITVREIGDYAFNANSHLVSVTIPDGFTKIGGSAFGGCTHLSTILIPDSITTISYSAFMNCLQLQSIRLPANLASIGVYAFQNCRSLQTIALPASLTQIDDPAFALCPSLASFAVDPASRSYSAVQGVLFNLTGSHLIAYPEAKTDHAYTIPATVTTVHDFAFARNSSLTSITIPEGVQTLGANCFMSCSGLARVSLPSTVKELRESTFTDCTSLASVALPEGLTTIGYSCFQSCPSLTNATIPSSVTTIDNFAFAYSGLGDLTMVSASPPSLGVTVFAGIHDFLVHVPDAAAVARYRSAGNWASYARRITTP